MEQAAQGGDGVTVPGGVEEMFRCSTEGHGLVGNIGDRWTVDWMIIEVSSNLDSVTL